jgi:CheY-like chemotaxis protein
MRRVLLIDNEEPSGIAIRVLLEANGCQVAIEHDSSKALETIRNYKPDVVLVNFRMPKAHGGNVACQLAMDQSLSQTRSSFTASYDQKKCVQNCRPRISPSWKSPSAQKSFCVWFISGLN